MKPSVSVILVGVGGYGAMYCSAFRDPRLAHCRIIGAVDPGRATPGDASMLAEHGVSVVPSISSLPDLAADVAIISSPLQFHADHTVEFLKRGTHVLCEKPLCATLEQAGRMARARDAAGRCVAIGYQWSFSAAIQKLKADINAGRLGAPRRLRTLVKWPRDEKYYRRNHWAGRRIDDAGRPVFDSPVNNAAAHFLHNMLYVLGDRPDRSAAPQRVTAELYRAHPIDNYDTAAIRCRVSGGAELLFYASHATSEYQGPTFVFEFDDATVRFSQKPGATITAEFCDRHTCDYGSPDESHYVKLFSLLDCINTSKGPLCGIEAAAAQTQVMIAAQQSVKAITPFPAEIVSWQGQPGERKAIVNGLDDTLSACYTSGLLPSESGIPWAIPGDEVIVPPWQPAEPELRPLSRPIKTATPAVVLAASSFKPSHAAP